MIHNLWKCFETTGNVQTYLSFKEYEKLQEMTTQDQETQSNDGLMNDGMGK